MADQALIQSGKSLYDSRFNPQGAQQAISGAVDDTFDSIRQARLDQQQEQQRKLQMEIQEENLLSLQFDREKRNANKQRLTARRNQAKQLLNQNNVNIAQGNIDAATAATKDLSNVIKKQPVGKDSIFAGVNVDTLTDEEVTKVLGFYSSQQQSVANNKALARQAVLNNPDFDSSVNEELFDVAEAIENDGYKLGAYNPLTNTADIIVTIADENGNPKEVTIPAGDVKTYFSNATPSYSPSALNSRLQATNPSAKLLFSGSKVTQGQFNSILNSVDGLFLNESGRASFVNSLDDGLKNQILADGVITQEEASGAYKNIITQRFSGMIGQEISAKDQADIDYKRAQTAKLRAEAGEIRAAGQNNESANKQTETLFDRAISSGNLYLLENHRGVGEIIEKDGKVYILPRKEGAKGKWTPLARKEENFVSIEDTQAIRGLLNLGLPKYNQANYVGADGTLKLEAIDALPNKEQAHVLGRLGASGVDVTTFFNRPTGDENQQQDDTFNTENVETTTETPLVAAFKATIPEVKKVGRRTKYPKGYREKTAMLERLQDNGGTIEGVQAKIASLESEIANAKTRRGKKIGVGKQQTLLKELKNDIKVLTDLKV